MPAAMQATPGKRGRPSKKQEAAAAPAPAPVTTLTVAQPAFTAAAAAAQPPMTMTMPIQSVPVMTAQPASVDARSMQVSYPLATSTQVPNSGPVVAKPNGLHLYVDCVPEHVATQSLSAYLNDAATAIAKRYNVVDIRVADSDPLKYGWRGVYAAVLQSSPPPNGHYVLDTRGNEFAMQAATALLPLCASFVRGR